MLPTTVSPSQWVTDPAFDADTLAASPITKTLGATLDCNVCSYDDGQVEWNLTAVVCDEAAAGPITHRGKRLFRVGSIG